MKIEGEPNGINLYVLTPQGPLFGGKSAPLADFTIVGVESEVESQARQSGFCRPDDKPHKIMTCGGGKFDACQNY